MRLATHASTTAVNRGTGRKLLQILKNAAGMINILDVVYINAVVVHSVCDFILTEMRINCSADQGNTLRRICP